MEFTTADIEAWKLLPKIKSADGDGKEISLDPPLKLVLSNDAYAITMLLENLANQIKNLGNKR